MPAPAFAARKRVLSAFIILNLFTVLFMNRPARLSKEISQALASSLAPALAYAMERSGRLVMRYAHLTGLDSRWTMFEGKSLFDWRYWFKADYGGREPVLLLLPGQGPWTFLGRNFFDFKEAKFHLNIYFDQKARRAYAYYLCRRYPVHKGSPIRSIIIELQYQAILEPDQARKAGSHLAPGVYRRPFDQFLCPGSGD